MMKQTTYIKKSIPRKTIKRKKYEKNVPNNTASREPRNISAPHPPHLHKTILLQPPPPPYPAPESDSTLSHSNHIRMFTDLVYTLTAVCVGGGGGVGWDDTQDRKFFAQPNMS